LKFQIIPVGRYLSGPFERSPSLFQVTEFLVDNAQVDVCVDGVLADFARALIGLESLWETS
jgi:hypothetical protein